MAANKQAATFLSIVSFCGLIYFTLKFSIMKLCSHSYISASPIPFSMGMYEEYSFSAM